MIDTKEIKEQWGGLSVEVFANLTNHPTKTDMYEALIDLKEIIDSHDELERKLKIACEIFEKIIRLQKQKLESCSHKLGSCYCCTCYEDALEVLKQIRGSNDEIK